MNSDIFASIKCLCICERGNCVSLKAVCWNSFIVCRVSFFRVMSIKNSSNGIQQFDNLTEIHQNCDSGDASVRKICTFAQFYLNATHAYLKSKVFFLVGKEEEKKTKMECQKFITNEWHINSNRLNQIQDFDEAKSLMYLHNFIVKYVLLLPD